MYRNQNVVLRCNRCTMHKSESLEVSLSARWTCNICGLAQPMLRIYHYGTVAECHSYVSILNSRIRNTMRG
uniref:MRN complex-interacting protein N-terminal domain-containing protein n=1 Tax=Tetranychus urticae TaxID=32264 RepID=T1K664_TETUR